jgi:histidinol-phosphate aminotransferase
MVVAKQMVDMGRLVRPEILAMLGYEPVEPPEVLARRFGIPPERIVKLDGNENPYGPSPKVIEALAGFDGYHRYPDPQQSRLREAIGEYAGVAPENIVAGHGSDEIIDLILRAVAGPGESVIDCPPTFGMYRFSTNVQGGRVIEVPRKPDWTLDIEAIREGASQAKVIFVPSPNNPTGNMLLTNELDALLETGLLIVVDEAYVEFTSGSVASWVSRHENLVVLRTFSKWAGLAGLRAGYGVMPRWLAEVLMQIKPPYTPNLASEVAMLASLDDKESLLERVAAIVDERERMQTALQALEFIEVFPSEANFLLCRFAGEEGRQVRDSLAERGVFVRYFDTPRLKDCIRISVGRREDTDRVIEAVSAGQASAWRSTGG